MCEELILSKRSQKEAILDMACGLNHANDHFRICLLDGIKGLLLQHRMFCEDLALDDESHDAFFKELERVVNEQKTEVEVKSKQETSLKRALVTRGDTMPNLPTFTRAPTKLEMEGYLFKKTRKTIGISTWQRRYFKIENSQFFYYKAGTDPEKARVTDIVLTRSVARPDLDRRFCFEIRSPSDSFLLQAQSQEDMLGWVNAINSIRESLLTPLDKELPSTENFALNTLRLLHPSNRLCADCRAADPEWVSINLGVLICINCSGAHRQLGSHISKVRSLVLDVLDPELYLMFSALGNDAANSIWEGALAPSAAKLSPDVDYATRHTWITNKYSKKLWVGTAPSDLTEAMFQAIKRGNVKKLLQCLSRGADVAGSLPPRKWSPLHAAVRSRSPACLALLLIYLSPVDAVDENNSTALHYAVLHDRKAETIALLRAGASLRITDSSGNNALSLAVEHMCSCRTLLEACQRYNQEQKTGECEELKNATAFSPESLTAAMKAVSRTRHHKKSGTFKPGHHRRASTEEVPVHIRSPRSVSPTHLFNHAHSTTEPPKLVPPNSNIQATAPVAPQEHSLKPPTILQTSSEKDSDVKFLTPHAHNRTRSRSQPQAPLPSISALAQQSQPILPCPTPIITQLSPPTILVTPQPPVHIPSNQHTAQPNSHNESSATPQVRHHSAHSNPDTSGLLPPTPARNSISVFCSDEDSASSDSSPEDQSPKLSSSNDCITPHNHTSSGSHTHKHHSHAHKMYTAHQETKSKHTTSKTKE
ncbi:centaurin beta [Pelomyxa schiedti]|nr:centaurin beta [Pelomyxa schiedti]